MRSFTPGGQGAESEERTGDQVIIHAPNSLLPQRRPHFLRFPETAPPKIMLPAGTKHSGDAEGSISYCNDSNANPFC
jgi:hypothetical protein